MKPSLVLCISLILMTSSEAFPGQRLFGKIKDDLARRKARGKKNADSTPAIEVEAATPVAEVKAAAQAETSTANTDAVPSESEFVVPVAAEEEAPAAAVEVTTLSNDIPETNPEVVEETGTEDAKEESCVSTESLPGLKPLLDAAVTAFEEAFGTPPTTAAYAPGRVNLIGEHTDYTGGFVLPLALEKRTVIVGTGAIVDVDSENSKCAVMSVGMNGGLVSFDADPATLAPGDPFWANYVKGVVKQYSVDLPPGKKFAFRAAFASDVPLGAGLSSSAALEVATATFLEGLAGVTAPAPETKAVRAQMAEHRFCNMPCGIMDQFISTLGQAGHLLLIDCRSNKANPVPLASTDVVILVTNSNVKHELSGSEYPERVKQCQTAADAIRTSSSDESVMQLRDATLSMLEAAKDSMDEVTYRRALHVVSENERVHLAAAALESGDFAAVGTQMLASHVSLRDNFEVSTPELDKLVELAESFEGVYGSRMTGGGFGGCTVTLLRASQADALIAHLKEGYKAATGKDADCFVTRPGAGAGPLLLA